MMLEFNKEAATRVIHPKKEGNEPKIAPLPESRIDSQDE
jgi:hypothetical protein